VGLLGIVLALPVMHDGLGLGEREKVESTSRSIKHGWTGASPGDRLAIPGQRGQGGVDRGVVRHPCKMRRIKLAVPDYAQLPLVTTGATSETIGAVAEVTLYLSISDELPLAVR
jgi:hypothetical protein